MNKKVCKNCHFLSKEHRTTEGTVYKYPLSNDERLEINKGNVNPVKSHYSINCYMGVWDEDLYSDKSMRIEKINNLSRSNSCFYYPFKPDMLFGAARELQKRQQENLQIKRSNLYTRIGLIIAAIGLMANAIVGFLNIFK